MGACASTGLQHVSSMIHGAPGAGEFVLVVESGSNFPETNAITGQQIPDPFVEVGVEGVVKRTHVVTDAVDPVWNVTMRFGPQPLGRTVRIHVGGKEGVVAGHTAVGQTSMSIQVPRFLMPWPLPPLSSLTSGAANGRGSPTPNSMLFSFECTPGMWGQSTTSNIAAYAYQDVHVWSAL